VIKQRVSDHHDRSPRPPATEPESQHDHEDDLDQAWLNGDIDAETLGGWSRTY
jgi:hypothetical protein